jgi:hypothetical protein
MASFTVMGPYEIPYEVRPGGRFLLCDEFWQHHPAMAMRKGCYVFAMRNRGLTPIYVGQATVSFKQEAFNVANINKYTSGFLDYGKGTPLMYFVVLDVSKGKTNKKQITEVEDFLIQAGVARNPDLQNVKGAQTPKWTIKGVIRGTPGKPSAAAKQFKSLFDIE